MERPSVFTYFLEEVLGRWQPQLEIKGGGPWPRCLQRSAVKNMCEFPFRPVRIQRLVLRAVHNNDSLRPLTHPRRWHAYTGGSKLSAEIPPLPTSRSTVWQADITNMRKKGKKHDCKCDVCTISYTGFTAGLSMRRDLIRRDGQWVCIMSCILNAHARGVNGYYTTCHVLHQGVAEVGTFGRHRDSRRKLGFFLLFVSMVGWSVVGGEEAWSWYSVGIWWWPSEDLVFLAGGNWTEFSSGFKVEIRDRKRRGRARVIGRYGMV